MQGDQAGDNGMIPSRNFEDLNQESDAGNGKKEKTFLGRRNQWHHNPQNVGFKEQGDLDFAVLVMSFASLGKMGREAKLMRETVHSILTMFNWRGL